MFCSAPRDSWVETLFFFALIHRTSSPAPRMTLLTIIRAVGLAILFIIFHRLFNLSIFLCGSFVGCLLFLCKFRYFYFSFSPMGSILLFCLFIEAATAVQLSLRLCLFFSGLINMINLIAAVKVLPFENHFH